MVELARFAIFRVSKRIAVVMFMQRVNERQHSSPLLYQRKYLVLSRIQDEVGIEDGCMDFKVFCICRATGGHLFAEFSAIFCLQHTLDCGQVFLFLYNQFGSWWIYDNKEITVVLCPHQLKTIGLHHPIIPKWRTDAVLCPHESCSKLCVLLNVTISGVFFLFF